MRYSLVILSLILGISVPAFAVISQADLEKAYLSSYKAEQSGKYDIAITALDPVLKEFPGGYTLNLRMAYLHNLSKHYPTALEHYNKAILVLPNALDSKLGKMNTLIVQGKYAEAEIVGYQVTNLDYSNYYANLNLVYCLRMQQKYELADKIATKMLSLYPIDSSFLAEYGILKYISGNLDQSRRVFSDILVLNPYNVLAKDYIKLIDKLLDAKKAAVKTPEKK